MAKQVILSPLASINYENIINYLIENWGISVAGDFVERFQTVVELLSGDSNIYAFINKSNNTQKCVVTKHNVLYFRKVKGSIEIITIFDTRQDPKKLRLVLKK